MRTGAAGQGRDLLIDRWLCAASALLVVCCSLARADESKAGEARRLADAALAGRKHGDHLQTGWEEVYDHGVTLANQAVALDPSVADAYYALFVNIGRKAERSGVAAQATELPHLKKLLKKTLELNPRHADAWEARGEMLLRLPRLLGGSTADGERALRHSAELAPKWAKPPLRLAALEWKRGREDEARNEAKKALDLARSAGDPDLEGEAEALLRKIGDPSP